MVYCYFVVRITIVVVVYLSSLWWICFGVLFCFYLRLYWSVLLLAVDTLKVMQRLLFSASAYLCNAGGGGDTCRSESTYRSVPIQVYLAMK